MKNIKTLIAMLILLISIASACDNILDPEQDNTLTFDVVESLASYTEGLLMPAYTNISTQHSIFNLAYGSDDAVNNDPSHPVKIIVKGGWTSEYDPFKVWETNYNSIFYINYFLEKTVDYEWYKLNSDVDSAYAVKLRGEAYALRAWNYFHLLQAHAGLGSNDEMLGVPIVKEVLSSNNPEDYQIPRSTYNESVQFILDDCDSAIARLPERYDNTGDFDLDIALGINNTNRINGAVARLLKAKILLYAASPAYSDGTYTYQMAADAAAQLMNKNDGLLRVNGSNSDNLEFYNNSSVYNSYNYHEEVLWYSCRQDNQNSWEVRNYPPSLYGEGFTNPTQDLVNAFPLVDGTPTPVSKINSADPYSDRDPRLSKYILYNGATFKRGSKTITIDTKEGSQDALGSEDNLATWSGYYLKKFMNVKNVDLNPEVIGRGTRYYTYARYTDALLIFAEAANEAVGPDENIQGYSARAVINAIRDRAGISSTTYVDGLSKAEMTDLIRNERRLEMCFENQRFWDLRRWEMLAEMKTPVNGVNVSADGSQYTYKEIESRDYKDYQIYGPIPYYETIKYPMVQNLGWQ